MHAAKIELTGDRIEPAEAWCEGSQPDDLGRVLTPIAAMMPRPKPIKRRTRKNGPGIPS